MTITEHKDIDYILTRIEPRHLAYVINLQLL